MSNWVSITCWKCYFFERQNFPGIWWYCTVFAAFQWWCKLASLLRSTMWTNSLWKQNWSCSWMLPDSDSAPPPCPSPFPHCKIGAIFAFYLCIHLCLYKGWSLMKSMQSQQDKLLWDQMCPYAVSESKTFECCYSLHCSSVHLYLIYSSYG